MKTLSFIVLVTATISILVAIGHFLFGYLKETSLFVGNEEILSVLIIAILVPTGVVLMGLDYRNYVENKE